MPVESPWPFILKKFPSNEFAVLQEVRDQAGFGASRSADGIVMGLWPSRGLELQGIEVKSYRSDWLSELKKPQKAEKLFKYCDRWWLVTAHEDVAKLEEIPVTWGWMSVVKNKLVVMKDAPKLEPCILDRSFLAAILKRATGGMIPKESIADEIAKAKEQAIANKYTADTHLIKNLREELDSIKKVITAFEEASGVNIRNRWDAKSANLGAAVKFVLDGGVDKMKQDLLRLQTTADNLKQSMDKHIISLFPQN